MEFDLVTGIASVIIAVTSALIIYFISKITMRGSSYDDVIKASKRQEKNNQAANSDHSLETKKLKKIKKKLKKEDLNAASCQNINGTATVNETENHPLEEIKEPLNMVVLLSEQSGDKPVITNKGKNKPKAFKKLKDTETIERVPNKLSEHKIEIESSKIDTKPKTDSTNLISVELTKELSTNSLDEEIPTSNEPSIKNKKKIKKKKPDGLSEESGKLSLSTLLPLLKQAEFSHGEVQVLIDALLNKDDSEWLKGKQDPMLKLKKQVVEMEKLHTGDTETITGLQVKLSSLRSELNAEKSNNKSFREALTKANNDLQALSVKIQHSTEENQSLHMHIQQLKQQVNEGQLIIVKLQEEKLLNQQMNIPHEQHHEAVLTLQTQLNQLAAQLQDEQTINVNLAAQLDESMRVEEEYRQVNALNVELDHLLSNSQFEVNRLNGELVSLSKQLEDARGQIDNLSDMIEAIETQKKELLNENEHLKVEVSKVSQDARTYQKMVDTLELNLQENKKNGNINFHNDHSKCQSLLDEKEIALKTLNLELNQKENIVEKLTNDVISCKNEANKKQTVIENLNVELASLKSLATRASVELNEEKSAAAHLQATTAENEEVITKLTVEVENYKHRNNELRSKNWKVVEALEKAEASLKELSSRELSSVVDSSSVSMIKCRINRLMQSFISPSGSENIANIEDNDLWLTKVEEILNDINKEPKSDHVLAQNAQLQNLVTHYRSVINDLEKMLLDLELRIESANKIQKSSTSPEVDVDD